MNEQRTPSLTENNASSPTDGWGILVGALALGLIFAATLASPVILWIIWDGAIVSGIDFPLWVSPLVALLAAGFVLVALGLLGRFWRVSTRYKALFQTWAASALFPFFMLPLRFLAPASVSDQAGTAVFWQIGGALLFWLFLGRLAHAQNRPGDRRAGSFWPAALLVPLLFWTWFRAGAFGSWDDLLLQLLAGLLFGAAAGRLLGRFFLPALYETGAGPGWNIALGAIAAGGALLIMGPAFGLFGQTLLLMAVLPTLGWPLMVALALGREPAAENYPTAGWLIGLATALMLALADADELNLYLLLEPGELFTWLVGPAGLTIGTALALGLAGLLLGRRLPRLLPRPVGLSLALLLWGGTAAFYFLNGQPGFYGDRLFVIFNEQADVSAAVEIANLDQRRQYVYDALTAQAEHSQADLRATLDRFGVDYQPYYLVNALEVEASWPLYFWLKTRPEIDRVLPSYTMRPLPEPRPPAVGAETRPGRPQWNLTLIGADRVWDEFGVRGAGVTVGQSDSGVDLTHPELADSYRGETSGNDYNWYDPWYGTQSPVDLNGHGTHTLGSVLGNTVGVAPDATWFACANLQRPLGSPAFYLDCLQFMLAPWPLAGDPLHDGRPDLAADVLNNSWGCPTIEGCDPASLRTAAAALRAAGIFFVVSAGNDGIGGCGTVSDPPAIYDEVFSVGAVNEQEQLAIFSSRGPVTVDGSGRTKPDIVAPGEHVLSAFPGGTYEYTDGTSMAGPHVAGVVALVWSANPALIGQIEATEQILIESAHRLPLLPGDTCGGAALPNNLEGYGLVDAYAAVALALQQK